MYDISVSTMCIYCDYCVYHYKSTELVSLYTLDIGLKIDIIINKYYYNTFSNKINCNMSNYSNNNNSNCNTI